ncbi:MAG: septal ring lytic transglycosylase RlpA family protein [Halieaceae bacterium]|nr:septal ring lytic transglycosylase RlpA family protein [Halieaceae bacterium]
MRAKYSTSLLLALVLCSCAGPQPGPESTSLPTPEETLPQQTDGPPEELSPFSLVSEATPLPTPILAAGNRSPYRVAGVEYQVLKSARGYRERGVASWYGRKFHGRPTATGEIFDLHAPSAAHRSLPLPTYVRVTNLENHRSMIVKVNDRGPFHPGRLIDLSYGAAQKLGFSEQGTALVEVVALSVAGVSDLREEEGLQGWLQDYRFLQLASFRRREAALALQKQLRYNHSEEVKVVTKNLDGKIFYQVKLGPITDRRALLALRERMIAEGFVDANLVAE